MALLLLAACSDYELKSSTVDPAVDPSEETGGSLVDTSGDTGDTDPPAEVDVEDSGELPVDCTGVEFGTWQWWGSQPFATEPDPADSAGIAYYDPSYSMIGWSTVALPDRNIPVGSDKVFLARFDLAEVPPDMTVSLTSDDGVWLYVNGAFVGHWGGEWQEEGCVNDGASCGARVEMDPVAVTGHLVAGSNVIAARVSNPVVNSWFELTAACVP